VRRAFGNGLSPDDLWDAPLPALQLSLHLREDKMMLQKYVNRQTDEMRRLPFEEDVPTTCAGDMAVGFLAAAAILAVIIGWLV